MFNKKYFSLLTFCFMLLAQNLFSQIILQGTVTDNGGEYLGNGAEPVVNALVTAIDQADTGRSFSAYTNEQGQYTIQITQTGIDDDPSGAPGNFRLLQNYPNPFNPSTVIGYELTKPADIQIKIYNVLGQKIKTLLDVFQAARSGKIIWDATNDYGQGVPAGVYIYSLKADGQRINKKMLLVDGKQGGANVTMSHSTGTYVSGRPVLSKQMSDQYVLKVTGNNIETYEQQNLEITDNMTLDITVIRTVTDIDDNVYRTVKIGDQWWMAENLKVTHYRNGDAISNVTSISKWADLTTSAYCAYKNNENNSDTYGYLYNWDAVDDNRNIAPEDWHVPTDEEWKELEQYLGTHEGKKLKATSGWHMGANGTNESGFSALPGGYRCNYGYFHDKGLYAIFWSSTESTELTSYNAWCRYLKWLYSAIYRINYDKQHGFSMRLVRDN